jgi:phosphocarrier protein HPr
MISNTLTIINKLGLHARASSKLVTIANQYQSKVTIEKDGQTANAKSLMTVMMLSASLGSNVTITADGDDEVAALEALITLIQNKFGEEQ